MHSLASSHSNMHYINALHCSNPTKTCPQLGIGAVTVKSFKKLARLSKASPEKVMSITRHQDLRSFKNFKKNPSPLAYYMK
jgi:hypothetical protein